MVHSHNETAEIQKRGILPFWKIFVLNQYWYEERKWWLLLLCSAGSDLEDGAFGYFITACFVILLAIGSYIALPKMVSPPLLWRKPGSILFITRYLLFEPLSKDFALILLSLTLNFFEKYSLGFREVLRAFRFKWCCTSRVRARWMARPSILLSSVFCPGGLASLGMLVFLNRSSSSSTWRATDPHPLLTRRTIWTY